MFILCREYLQIRLMTALGFPEALTPGLLQIAVAVASAVVAAHVAWRVTRIRASYRRYDPDEHGAKLNGIANTLIVVAILVCLEPLRRAAQIACNAFLFSSEAAAVIAQERGPATAWIIFNAAAEGMLMAFSILLVALFFLRRRSFRLVTIAYLATNALIFGVHDFFLSQIYTGNDVVVFENFDHVTLALQATILLSPYLLFSRRIHATMRN